VPPVEKSTGGEVKEKTDEKEGGNYCALSITQLFDSQHPNFWGFLKQFSPQYRILIQNFSPSSLNSVNLAYDQGML
jgi:hypothetical protein